jgi:hypothetical protein
MRTKTQTENLPTSERLNLALSAVAEPLRTELFNAFYIHNPIDFARLLLSLELPTDTTRELLLCKVSQPPAYKGPAIETLMERAVEKFWSRLSEEHSNVATTA